MIRKIRGGGEAVPPSAGEGAAREAWGILRLALGLGLGVGVLELSVVLARPLSATTPLHATGMIRGFRAGSRPRRDDLWRVGLVLAWAFGTCAGAGRPRSPLRAGISHGAGARPDDPGVEERRLHDPGGWVCLSSRPLGVQTTPRGTVAAASRVGTPAPRGGLGCSDRPLLRAGMVDGSRALARLGEPPKNAPNVLLIVMDTVRADSLSAYGYAQRDLSQPVASGSIGGPL